jgi:glycerol kinase
VLSVTRYGAAPVGVVVAVDAGTTGVRALAVDQHGRPVAWAYEELPQHFPQPGWVEHDPDEIMGAVRSTLRRLTSELAAGEAIAAIGITDQRETAVVWSRRTGRPLHRAIVWQDRRTAARCDELREAGHLDAVRATTGLVLDPYFSATKLEWLLTQGGVERTADLAFGTVDSWVLWHLTGGDVHATDPSNASRTLLYDVRALAWSPAMCELFGVPESCLPEVRPSSGRFGVTRGLADVGVPDGTPVSGIAGDQQSALFGQACFVPGMTKNTYGTGSFVLMNVGPTCPPPVEGLLTTVAWVLADGTVAYALEGAIFVTGAAVQWLRDGLGLIAEAAEIGPLAASVGDTDGVYVVPAFTGLGSPYWDPYARGTVVGLTRGVGRAHLARAVVEAMAYQTRDVVDAMCEAAGRPVAALRADGGASVMDLLLQLQADQLQVPVSRPVVQETTALGAAYLAGLAEGVWGSLDEVAAHWALDVEVAPLASKAVADQRYRGWQRAVERARGWAAAEP